MRAAAKIGLVVAGIGLLGACDLVAAALGLFSQIDLLGVIPAAGFSDMGSKDYGKVKFAVTGRDDIGAALAPALNELEVIDDAGGTITPDGGEEIPGTELGSFLLVADGSGSTEADIYCSGCPTDPDRIRVTAVQQLADELGECGGWRMSLVEFGLDEFPGPVTNKVLADWSTHSADIEIAAEQLSSGWRTPLWDAVIEGVDRIDTDHQKSFDSEKADAGRGLVVISDGVDTASRASFDDAVAAATAVGLPVHTIGFGPASDSGELPDQAAIEGLRRLAEATGGTYGYVSDVNELPALTTAIAGAMCGGYTELTATYDSPPPSGTPVTGLIRLKSQPEFGIPFLFRAP
jgi:hypothetical protein